MKAQLRAVHPDTGGSHEEVIKVLGQLRPVPKTIPLTEDDARVLTWLEQGELPTPQIVARLGRRRSLVRSRLHWLERHGVIHAVRQMLPRWPHGRRPVDVWHLGKKPIAARRKALVA